ncbi:MAG: SPFH domain-containing protein [Thermomicrobiales bacterium]|nr:SPFH domain-containing protein [Thermomicrobiales bacterium]MCO5223851.1 SPFH domain-containing protein [Thermomicrobiales bacterium]MCO5227415.1 SPFH domain-containing protein [Thermomicrobiales bacterium]
MAILDLIQLTDEGAGDIVRRVPETGAGEFRLGSQLVVRENQQAVFMRDGKALDVFGPGRHTLSTNNIPLLGRLIGMPFGGNSPFTAEVFFVNMREFTNLKWGSSQPIAYRDTDLGMVRLRAFGTYSMRVKDPQVLVNQIVGTRGAYRTSDIEDFLRSVVIQEFTDTLGDVQTSILDLPKMMNETSAAIRASLADDFAKYGFELTSFQIEAITPPEEVQKMIDQRSGMSAIGNMDDFIKYQTAQGIRDAANNPGTAGDGASMGMGMGAGIGMAGAMAGAFRDAFSGDSNSGNQPQNTGQQAPVTGESKFCTECGAQIPASAKFCPQCGAKQG